MTSILKSALGQAVRDILAENSSANRFGITLTPGDVDTVSLRIAELFETSLELRSRYGAGLGQAQTSPADQVAATNNPRRPTPANDPEPKGLPSSTLPRKRTAMTDAERERLRRG